jgi:hypothetical protein
METRWQRREWEAMEKTRQRGSFTLFVAFCATAVVVIPTAAVVLGSLKAYRKIREVIVK